MQKRGCSENVKFIPISSSSAQLTKVAVRNTIMSWLVSTSNGRWRGNVSVICILWFRRSSSSTPIQLDQLPEIRQYSWHLSRHKCKLHNWLAIRGRWWGAFSFERKRWVEAAGRSELSMDDMVLFSGCQSLQDPSPLRVRSFECVRSLKYSRETRVEHSFSHRPREWDVAQRVPACRKQQLWVFQQAGYAILSFLRIHDSSR